MSASATRTPPVSPTIPPEVSARAAFALAVEDAAAALGKPVSPGLTPTIARKSFAARATAIEDAERVFAAADPSWSTRCDDGQDRAPLVMLAYLIGCRQDGAARHSTIKRLAAASIARNQ